MKNQYFIFKCYLLFLICCLTLPSLAQTKVTEKQKADLELILNVLPPERTTNGRVSFLDQTFGDWLARTGELPPNFDQMLYG